MDSISDLEPQFANMHAFWLGYGREFREEGEIAVYRSGVPEPPLNGVLRLAEGRLDDNAILSVRRRMEGVPWNWRIGPDSARGLADRLLEHGATRIGQSPVMAVALDKVKHPAGPTGLKISEITDHRELSEWVECWAPAMGVAADATSALAQLEELRLARGDGMVSFVGRIGDEIVGSAALLDRHGVAGIYIVTCAEQRRRQGIGSAMTSAALLAGRERGLRFGTLQASEMGKPVYERMGFATVADFQVFVLPPLPAG